MLTAFTKKVRVEKRTEQPSLLTRSLWIQIIKDDNQKATTQAQTLKRKRRNRSKLLTSLEVDWPRELWLIVNQSCGKRKRSILPDWLSSWKKQQAKLIPPEFGNRTLPPDLHGRTRLTQGIATPLNLAELGKGDGGLKKQFGERGCVIIEQPAGTTGDRRRLNLLARTLSELVGTEKSHHSTTERPIGGKVLHLHDMQEGWGFLAQAAGALALALLIFPHLPWLLRFLASLGALGLILWWTHGALLAGLWVSLTSALICWGLFFLALICLHPRHKGYFDNKYHERGM